MEKVRTPDWHGKPWASQPCLALPALAILFSCLTAESASGVEEGAFSVERVIRDVAKKKHPYLLFTDIKETPGWKNKTKSPWSKYLKCIQDAVRKNVSIAVAWPGPLTGAIVHTDDVYINSALVAFMYQVTKDKKYAKKTADMLKKASGRSRALINPSARGKTSAGRVLGRLLIRYGLAYDWIQPTLSSAEDRTIRDRLAQLADKVCRKYPKYVNGHDRIIAACGLGVMACALADYKGETATKPVDWLRRGTINLFVKDDYAWPAGLHAGQEKPGRPALGCSCLPGGFNQGYLNYWSGPFAQWAAVYSSATGRNALEDFPIARGLVDTLLWESMPNRLESEHCTKNQYYDFYYHVLLPWLSPEERGGFKWYAENPPGVDEKQKWRHSYGEVWGGYFSFCCHNPDLPKKKPSWTSFFSPANGACVFRENWNLDADWLFFKVHNYPTPSHRWMMHNDNMCFEFYSHADYLLADSGEIKGRMRGYGPTYASGHNTLLVDGGGPVKEDISKKYFEFVNPAYFTNHSLEPWLPLSEGEMNITHVEADRLKGDRRARALETPVRWRRTLLYPGKEYFLLVDNAESDKKRDYEFLFHLSSFAKIRTRGTQKPGHVLGNLQVGNAKVNWAKNVTTDILTGAKPQRPVGDFDGGAQILWKTKNLRDKPVEMRLIGSSPADKISIGRTWGRVALVKGDFKGSGEVDHPYVRFMHSSKTVRKITAILTRYEDGEEKRKVSRVKVEGNGSALKIELGEVVDLVATGRGKMTFSKISTDAEISLVRLRKGKVETGLVIRGTALKYAGRELLSANDASHAAFHLVPGKKFLDLHVETKKDGTLVKVYCPFKAASATCAMERPDWKWGGSPHPLKKKARAIRLRQRGEYVEIEAPAGVCHLRILAR